VTGRSRRDDLAAQLSARFAAPGERPPEEKPEPAVRPTVNTKRIRRTVDLTRVRHHKLTERQRQLAVAWGVTSVPGQYLLEELVTLYLSDETVARRLEKPLRERVEREEQERERARRKRK
jgi:hypothetical protein